MPRCIHCGESFINGAGEERHAGECRIMCGDCSPEDGEESAMRLHRLREEQDEHFQAMVYAEYRNCCPNTDEIVAKYRAVIEAPLKAEIERLREALIHAEVKIKIRENLESIAKDIRADLAASPAEPEQKPKPGDVVVWPMSECRYCCLIDKYADDIDAEMQKLEGYRPPVLIMRAAEVQRIIEASR